jgi:aromatic ring-opening dioxygenase catalytic subunit (LigB family)
VPFRLMFGEEFTSIPIVQVSIDGSLSPDKNWAIGKAIAQLRLVQFTKANMTQCFNVSKMAADVLMPSKFFFFFFDREERILVLSGGLTAHNLRDRRSFSPLTATESHMEFDKAIHSAIKIVDVRHSSVFQC